MKSSPVKQWRRQKSITSLIGKSGIILNWTIIRVPIKAFAKEAPYPVVIVEMEDKRRMIGQLVDWLPVDLQKGRKITAVLRKARPEDEENIIAYTIKFKPHENN